MKTIAFVTLVLGGLGAIFWFMPGSPLVRLFPKEVAVPVVVDGTPSPEVTRTLKITTVLGKDAIPAILEPTFVSGAEAAAQLQPDSQVIGVSINGDHRAYSTAHLSGHEVVNDTVGGLPVVVTW